MRRVIKIGIGLLLGVLALVLAGVAIVGGLYLSADIVPPASERNFSVERRDSCGVIRYGESSLRHSRNGLWEMFLKGDADERGDAFGAMADSLIDHQERIFIRQIREIVPDEHYLRFLNVLTQVFNRHITRHIPEEYCREIARMSEHCSHKYDFIGTPYLRQLNYHAAHDIGHAMQDYMLVGCTGLAVWGESSEEGMIVGRNFDFWVGDEFASNRLLTFCRPERGYGFVSVGWPGMVGVLSGMNERGLTITLHAAKGELPLQSATPVSVLAREILQYASSVEEAVKIASRRKLFVSECFMIGSVQDGKCVVIEKTPERQDVYEASGNRLALSNHFRSEGLKDTPLNCENIARSDSRFRLERIEELASVNCPISVEKMVAILRDRQLNGGQDLGLANPMAINQQIAHHSVVFLPEKLQMWISTGEWGYGEWVCYDVGAILRGEKSFDGELTSENIIPADSLFRKNELPKLLQYRSLKHRLCASNVDSLAILNPSNWESYSLAGDFYRASDCEKALEAYRKALRLPMTDGDREVLRRKIEELEND